MTTALRAFFQTVFADVSAIITDCIRNVEGEVGDTKLNGIMHQLEVLLLGEMLIHIPVPGRASVKVAGELAAVKFETVEQI